MVERIIIDGGYRIRNYKIPYQRIIHIEQTGIVQRIGGSIAENQATPLGNSACVIHRGKSSATLEGAGANGM